MCSCMLNISNIKYQICSDLFGISFVMALLQKVGIGRSYLKSVHPSISMCDDHDDDDDMMGMLIIADISICACFDYFLLCSFCAYHVSITTFVSIKKSHV